MNLKDYYDLFVREIKDYISTGLIIDHKIRVDMRHDCAGIIEGEILFSDNSKLFWTEYVSLQEDINKITYSYHYQDKKREMIFRYDNAKHKPSLGFDDHKHAIQGISPTKIPSIKDVLEEIVGILIKYN